MRKAGLPIRKNKQISLSDHVVKSALEDQLIKLYLNFDQSKGFIDVDLNGLETANMSAGELR